jgi:hypothetical protein
MRAPLRQPLALAGVTAVKANTMAEHFIIARIFAPKQQDRFRATINKAGYDDVPESIRLSDPHCRPKGANMLSPRVLSVLGGLLWLLASALGPENSLALAQNADDKPADQQSSEPESAKGVQTVTEFAEAQRLLSGPAGNPECVWLGRRVVSLLWRDDMDTAFRHLDLYDRFGCPGGHIQAGLERQHRSKESRDPERARAGLLGQPIATCRASISGRRAKQRNALGRRAQLRHAAPVERILL